MKRYIKSSAASGNKNAVAIATEVFGDDFRSDWAVNIYKQSKGYALKYFAYSSAEAKDTLKQFEEAAQDLNIPVIRSTVKFGTINGSVTGWVASIVVPAV